MDDERWEDWVARNLKGSRLHEPPAETVERAVRAGEPDVAAAAPRRRAWSRALWPLAAAASLTIVVAAGWMYRQYQGPPELPAPVAGSAVRGARVVGLSPVGPAAAAPESLTWTAHDLAERYRVRLFAVDDTLIWEESATATSVEVPAGIRARLRGAVSYRWQVEALDAAGEPVAASERVQFDLAP